MWENTNRGPTGTRTKDLSLTLRALCQLTDRATWSTYDINVLQILPLRLKVVKIGTYNYVLKAPISTLRFTFLSYILRPLRLIEIKVMSIQPLYLPWISLSSPLNLRPTQAYRRTCMFNQYLAIYSPYVFTSYITHKCMGEKAR